jgi:hypothetical protein
LLGKKIENYLHNFLLGKKIENYLHNFLLGKKLKKIIQQNMYPKMSKYNRGKMFVRATEVLPFTQEHKSFYMECMKSMLAQIDILNKTRSKNYTEKVKIIETMFKTIMEYPEILARHPKYRNTVNAKIYELESQIKDMNLGESIILNDAKYYIKMLSARPDYNELNNCLHILITPCNVTPIKKHSYNLRPRNKQMKFVF